MVMGRIGKHPPQCQCARLTTLPPRGLLGCAIVQTGMSLTLRFMACPLRLTQPSRWVFFVTYITDHAPLPDLTLGQMSITIAIAVVVLPVACIAAATALMRFFDVKAPTPEQSQAEAEKLLAQFNTEVRVRRRVRAGPPSNAELAGFQRFSPLSATRVRFPSA